MMNALSVKENEKSYCKKAKSEREGKQEQAWKLKGQAIEVTYDHVVAFVKNIPMDDDFAIAFVAGNIDRDSRIKKNSFQSPKLVKMPGNENSGTQINQLLPIKARFTRISRLLCLDTPLLPSNVCGISLC